MQRCQTLPRPGPSEAPPPPPHQRGGTLTRKNKDSDINRLINEIDMLSHQLSLMKAELESNISKSKKTEQENEMENYTASRNDVLDSRLSTVLFLPSFTSSIRNTPTPPPTHIIVPKVAIENQLPITPASFCEDLQGTKFQLQRQPICIPSSSVIMPQIQHKNKVTRLGGTSLRNLSNDIQLMRKRAVAPPKPKRTFMEAMNKPTTSNFSVITKTSAFLSSPIIILPKCSHEEFLRIIQERFQQGHCWFCRAGELFFVNPFNNISSTKSIFYRAISSISISLFEHENAALIFRGLPGSGKSKLSEMVCLELVDRLDSRKEVAAILCSALLALRPFLTTNKKYNNQSSRAVHHYEINIRDSRLSRIILRHFLIDTPSRHCRANIFAMLANDMNEQEKEKLRISAFHLREKYANYGNLNDVQRSLEILGLPVNDIFKVLSACTLLNNLIFKNMKTFIDIENLPDLEDASHLLGISVLSLYRTLMSSTITSTGSIHECENKRDEFVSAIYSRLVKAIHDKANSMLSTLLEASNNDNSFNDSAVMVEASDNLSCTEVRPL